MKPPTSGDDWVGLTQGHLPLEAALEWAVRPECGAVVNFVGTVRDHAEGRPGVTGIEYEAYAEHVEPRLSAIARAARERWERLGRVVLLHRVGPLSVTEASVLVVASTPHRAEAFAAARFCIDTLKATVPIWKRESWSGGVEWGSDARDVIGVVERA
ncbi:MAG TPA: molybdenum cofactor biosynthesis protein MoaE [Acidimicrobiales bacterium]|nr:molybdenum cofactor biosynthesis protein MoaE [Acidimicrobiales bacterium]